jgi:hypothetical protein
VKRVLSVAAALCLLVTSALAQPLTEAAPLGGERLYPEGAASENALYVFRYACPQFTADTDAATAVNAYFASLAADMAAAGVPDAVDGLPVPEGAEGPAYYTQLDYLITANTDDVLSVLLQSRQFLGNAETESWTAVVFALSGVYAGQPLSLSQATGLEQDAEDGSGDSYAAGLVYGLVWQIIQEQRAMLTRDYFPELTQADLESVFSPESDFYVDENGNFVFFVQSGMIAGEVDGILTYPFSLSELLSAVRS